MPTGHEHHTVLDIELGEDARAEALRPVTWDEWITLPVREGVLTLAKFILGGSLQTSPA